MRRIRCLAAVVLVVATVGCGVAGGGDSGTPGAADSATSETRTVEHSMGTTEVPSNPKRVVVLDTGVLDAAVSLGVQPAGAVRVDEGQGVPGYLRDAIGDAKLVGTILEPNIEAIAALKPDLILTNKVRHQDIYDELSGIAPTVMAESLGVTWKHNFKLFAKALGMQDKAESMLAAYEQRTQDLGDELGSPGEIDVSVVRFLPGEIRLYQQESFIGTILSDVGLARPESQNGDTLMRTISPERIAMADGDAIFTTTYGPKEETQVGSVTDSRLWQRLDGVQSGNVHFVPDSYWMVGIGIGAANHVLDDLEKYLVGQNPAAD